MIFNKDTRIATAILAIPILIAACSKLTAKEYKIQQSDTVRSESRINTQDSTISILHEQVAQLTATLKRERIEHDSKVLELQSNISQCLQDNVEDSQAQE